MIPNNEAMSGWSTNSNWFLICIGLSYALIFLLASLKDANRRKNELGGIARNLNDELKKLKHQ